MDREGNTAAHPSNDRKHGIQFSALPIATSSSSYRSIPSEPAHDMSSSTMTPSKGLCDHCCKRRLADADRRPRIPPQLPALKDVKNKGWAGAYVWGSGFSCTDLLEEHKSRGSVCDSSAVRQWEVPRDSGYLLSCKPIANLGHW